MAVLTGFVVEDSEYPLDNTRIGLGLSSYGVDYWPPYNSIVTEPTLKSTVTSALPVSANNIRSVSAFVQRSFFDDYYNRIHINPPTIDLGYLLSEQTVEVDVWNAYLVPKTLTDITGTSAELTVTGPDDFPEVFGAIQLSEYQVTASKEGGSTISVNLQWVFSSANQPQLPVEGTRALVWHFPANWESPVVERLEWLTDVLRHEDGSEQRISLRDAPRVAYDFSFATDGKLRRQLGNELYDLGGTPWALPIWADGSRLTSALTAGGFSISVPTTLKDYYAGGVAVVMSEDFTSYEAVEIDSLNSTTLTLERALENNWPAGSWIYPARIARLTEAPQLRALTADYVEGSAAFEVLEPVARTYSAESPTYRSHPVLTQQPNWRDGLGMQFRRQLSVFDSLTGQPSVVDRSALGEPNGEFVWTAFDRSEVDALRKFVYSRKGRAKGIWVPSFLSDLVLITTVGSAGVVMNVAACGVANHAGGNNRRDIRVEMADGTIYYRRVVSTGTIDSNTESLTIDTAFGVSIDPANVKLISWMTFCRLDDDAVEMQWASATVAESIFNLTGPRNGV